MKTPIAPPIWSAFSVNLDEVGTLLWPPDIAKSAGLSPEETDSINGMTLETSRRLTAAVSNLADFFSNDPEFAAIVNPEAGTGALAATQTANASIEAGRLVAASVDVVATVLDVGLLAPAGIAAEGKQRVIDQPGNALVDKEVVRNPSTFVANASNGVKNSAQPGMDEIAPSVQFAAVGTTNAAAGSTTSMVDVGPNPAAPSSRSVSDLRGQQALGSTLDDVVSVFDRGGLLQDNSHGPNFLYTGQSSDLQVINNQREGQTAGDSIEAQKERGAVSTGVEGAIIPTRQQRDLPLIPYNRRLETNGVDRTTLLDAEYLGETNAYAGHDASDWIKPSAIGAARMSTDGGTSPPPMFFSSDEEPAIDETPSALLITARVVTPLVVLPPVAVQRTQGRRGRHARLTALYRQFHSIRPWRQAPLIAINFFSSGPRSISAVECAVCWVDADSHRRGSSMFNLVAAPV